ncbi:MAG: sulfatase [Lentisphaeraceae bacterium]|nr:sulfatase [Lentisphaeraceae bacterium]
MKICLRVLILLFCAQVSAKEQRPNILFIMADDHATGAISSYGSKLIKTPHIDKLARQGMRFESSFVTNSICMPSRAVLLTGKYNHLNGVETFRDAFDGAQQTFPKILQQSGYTTGIVGKWHLKSNPTGFDTWKILPGQGKYHNPAMKTDKGGLREKGFCSDIVANEAISFMRKNKESNKPFMFMCHFKAPHTPHDYHPRYQDEFTADLPYPKSFNDDYKTRPVNAYAPWFTKIENMGKHANRLAPSSLESIEDRRKFYYQEFFKGYLRLVRGVDDNVGRIMTYLEESGLADNTIVIYTSDNGFFMGEHGWFNKMWMYEESLRVPLIVRYPKKIKVSVNKNDMLLNLDLAPTILDLAGAKIPKEIQGRSFKKILFGKTPEDWRQSIYYHYKCGWGVPSHYGIRTKTHKLIHFYDAEKKNSKHGWQLFSLQKDPGEMHNRYNNPEYKSIRESLEKNLIELQKEFLDNPLGKNN